MPSSTASGTNQGYLIKDDRYRDEEMCIEGWSFWSLDSLYVLDTISEQETKVIATIVAMGHVVDFRIICEASYLHVLVCCPGNT
jgi:hypothetical protein